MLLNGYLLAVTQRHILISVIFQDTSLQIQRKSPGSCDSAEGPEGAYSLFAPQSRPWMWLSPAPLAQPPAEGAAGCLGTGVGATGARRRLLLEREGQWPADGQRGVSLELIKILS